ncbi:MAG TPA: zinc-dependent alcohol dehydrogenase family protein [Patescibacteria group bacterium]|nr:zinc-dependent alcohol dehydrogenase family protein [Patescibacteria group bacterium]
MKAALVNHPASIDTRPLALVDVPDPVPGPDELLVKVSACGVCRTDLHVVEGDLPVRKSPVVPGHQIVGRVESHGAAVHGFARGDRVGVAWLHRTCGVCRFCVTGRENLCDAAGFTGWTVDGGYAERVVASSAFTYRLPEALDDTQAAPLLCAGIIGYRALRLTGCGDNGRGWAGARLGIYGFGAAGHVAIQVARFRGAEVYVCTRDRERHQHLAADLGATWVGGSEETPPVALDAAVIFAPAGELVPVALAALDKSGVLVLGGIHMSAIPRLDYSLLYGERVVRTVANNTREDGRLFLEEAARVPVRAEVRTFALGEANDALIALKHDAIRGAGVLVI